MVFGILIRLWGVKRGFGACLFWFNGATILKGDHCRRLVTWLIVFFIETWNNCQMIRWYLIKRNENVIQIIKVSVRGNRKMISTDSYRNPLQVTMRYISNRLEQRIDPNNYQNILKMTNNTRYRKYLYIFSSRILEKLNIWGNEVFELFTMFDFYIRIERLNILFPISISQ